MKAIIHQLFYNDYEKWRKYLIIPTHGAMERKIPYSQLFGKEEGYTDPLGRDYYIEYSKEIMKFSNNLKIIAYWYSIDKPIQYKWQDGKEIKAMWGFVRDPDHGRRLLNGVVILPATLLS